MHSAVAHLHGFVVRAAADAAVPTKDLSPLAIEPKELIWGGASFVVFAILMRFVLVPKVKKGMEARYASIRNAHDAADAERAAARHEVADYEAQLAAIKAEGAREVDAARTQLESERQSRLAEVNARLNQQRAAAASEAEAQRAAVRDQIHAAVRDVAGRAGELAVGRRPSDDVVDRVVSEVMAR